MKNIISSRMAPQLSGENYYYKYRRVHLNAYLLFMSLRLYKYLRSPTPPSADTVSAHAYVYAYIMYIHTKVYV